MRPRIKNECVSGLALYIKYPGQVLRLQASGLTQVDTERPSKDPNLGKSISARLPNPSCRSPGCRRSQLLAQYSEWTVREGGQN